MFPLPQPVIAVPVLADTAPGIVAALAQAASHGRSVFLTPEQCRLVAGHVGGLVGDAAVFDREG